MTGIGTNPKCQPSAVMVVIDAEADLTIAPDQRY